MTESRMQASRFEFKYLVNESAARQLRDRVQLYLRPDAFTKGDGYFVHSLYLDSPDLQLCQQTVIGQKNRFKLRLRFYDDQPNSPVFLEVKRRVTVGVLKKRACIRRSAVDALLAHFQPEPDWLLKVDQKNLDGLYTFCELAQNIDARPAAYTSYQREAYESTDDNSQRVTFDRHLRAGAYSGTLSCHEFEKWPRAPLHGVVFEMKFTGRYPTWMHDLAQEFDLDRISVPKYVECINLLDERRANQHQTERRFVLDSPLHISQQMPSSVAWQFQQDTGAAQRYYLGMFD